MKEEDVQKYPDVMLVSGIPEEIFRQGYDKSTKTYDKRKTIFIDRKIFSAHALQRVRFLEDLFRHKDVKRVCDNWEPGSSLPQDEGTYFMKAVYRSNHDNHTEKNRPLVIASRMRNFEIAGNDYKVEEESPGFYSIKPGIIKIERIMAVKDVEYLMRENNRIIKSVVVEDITYQF